MTFLNGEGKYELEAKTQANRPARCICCGEDFKQNADNGVYGLTFCGSCISKSRKSMPEIKYPTNAMA